MGEEWKRTEVLLEGMRGDIKAVAEGHQIIRREIQELKTELKCDIKEVNDALKFVAKELGDKLDSHMRQPAHIG